MARRLTVWQEARQTDRESRAILQTEPTGQKPLPVPHSCWALRSETEGMFLGQPRDEEPVLGQERLAVLMVSDSPPARILDLQLFWNGLRTLAHSWSHCVGRPFVQPPPWALQHTAPSV